MLYIVKGIPTNLQIHNIILQITNKITNIQYNIIQLNTNIQIQIKLYSREKKSELCSLYALESFL